MHKILCPQNVAILLHFTTILHFTAKYTSVCSASKRVTRSRTSSVDCTMNLFVTCECRKILWHNYYGKQFYLSALAKLFALILSTEGMENDLWILFAHTHAHETHMGTNAGFYTFYRMFVRGDGFGFGYVESKNSSDNFHRWRRIGNEKTETQRRRRKMKMKIYIMIFYSDFIWS